jgi:hypothetical protein
VPSRARLLLAVLVVLAVLVGCGGVGDELPVDHIGQSSAQAAQGFQRRLAFGELAAVVGAPRGVVADLADRGDVEDVVQPSVAGAGEPVADLGAGGGVEGDGAGPGGEPVAVGEPGHVADVGQDPGGTARADAVRSMRPDPVAATVCRNRRASCFSLSSRACTSATSSTASSRRVRPGRSRGRTDASIVLACMAVRCREAHGASKRSRFACTSRTTTGVPRGSWAVQKGWNSSNGGSNGSGSLRARQRGTASAVGSRLIVQSVPPANAVGSGFQPRFRS